MLYECNGRGKRWKYCFVWRVKVKVFEVVCAKIDGTEGGKKGCGKRLRWSYRWNYEKQASGEKNFDGVCEKVCNID